MKEINIGGQKNILKVKSNHFFFLLVFFLVSCKRNYNESDVFIGKDSLMYFSKSYELFSGDLYRYYDIDRKKIASIISYTNGRKLGKWVDYYEYGGGVFTKGFVVSGRENINPRYYNILQSDSLYLQYWTEGDIDIQWMSIVIEKSKIINELKNANDSVINKIVSEYFLKLKPIVQEEAKYKLNTIFFYFVELGNKEIRKKF